MLKQAKDTTLDEIEDDFSDLGVLDDSNSMYMVSALQSTWVLYRHPIKPCKNT